MIGDGDIVEFDISYEGKKSFIEERARGRCGAKANLVTHPHHLHTHTHTHTYTHTHTHHSHCTLSIEPQLKANLKPQV